jgi:hypothetical protein
MAKELVASQERLLDAVNESSRLHYMTGNMTMATVCCDAQILQHTTEDSLRLSHKIF